MADADGSEQAGDNNDDYSQGVKSAMHAIFGGRHHHHRSFSGRGNHRALALEHSRHAPEVSSVAKGPRVTKVAGAALSLSHTPSGPGPTV
jgi:hypothetical protein